MKAIILAGGQGTRLYPQTKIINKHLLSIYDKPMIYHPLSIAMLSKIKDIAIVCNKKDKKDFFNLLGDGSNLGIKLTYNIQQKSDGIVGALKTCEKLGRVVFKLYLNSITFIPMCEIAFQLLKRSNITMTIINIKAFLQFDF